MSAEEGRVTQDSKGSQPTGGNTQKPIRREVDT